MSDPVVVDWTEPAPAGGAREYVAPLHIHHQDNESWEVVEGRLGVRVGDDEVFLEAGESVLVPRGTPHTYWNASGGPTRYRLTMTTRIQALIDALHSGSDQPVEEIFAAHASEYLRWP